MSCFIKKISYSTIKILHTHIVPSGVKNIRLQNYAPTVFYEYIPSNSGIKKAIKKGLFTVNGEIATTATWIQSKQVINLIEGIPKPQKVFQMPLTIVYEDDFLAVIQKPAGITVSGNAFKTISNALAYNLTKSTQPDTLFTPTAVHRLDNQTSGLLLIAKTKSAQVALGNQFKNNTIQKTYHAIAIGKVIKTLSIKTPIAHKSAVTHIETIASEKSLKYQEISLLKIYPKTGRTHQIRIHLSSIGHPIVGDKLYTKNTVKLYKEKGLFLCATNLVFTHPKTLKEISLTIKLPHKFTAFINREKKRWITYNS